MSATILQFPPRYRIAWDNGHTIGFVIDEETGDDWESRYLDEVNALMNQLRSYYSHIIFWRVSSDDPGEA